MRLREIDPLMRELAGDLPVAYYAFPRPGQAPPYMVYYSPGRDDLMADNINYAYIMELDIELYTRTKRWDLEEAIEQQLTAAGLAYSKTEAIIESDGLIEIIYTTEVLIDG